MIPVWSCNWPALLLLLACVTAWRSHVLVDGDRLLTIYDGLSYVDVDVIIRNGGHSAVAFGDLQAMEWAALPILNGSKA